MKPNKYFDDQIRAALKSLEASYDPASWDMLEEQLDAPAANVDDTLDSIIASRLAVLEIPLQAGDWSLMEQRIETEETAELIESEAHIDNLAYEKLHHFEVPYQSHHWSLMAKRLEEEFSLRHKLYRYKVAEIALMFLMLLTIIRFLPLAEELFRNQKDTQIDEQFYIAPESPVQPENTNDAEQQQTSPDNNNSFIIGIPIASGSTSDKSGNNGFASEYTLGRSANLLDYNNPGNSNNGSYPAIPNPVFSPIELTPLAGRITLSDILAKSKLPASTQNQSTSKRAKTTDFIASLDLGPVESGTVPALILPQVNPFSKKKELRFSIFATADYSYVFTPSDRFNILDTLISTRSDTTAASGYGGGILVNFKKGRWELQTGGIYSFKRYVPNTPVFLFETVKFYVEENFHGIQQDILQVPLNLQYHFKNTGNWRFYGLSGASMNFVTSSIYEIRYRRTPTFNLGIPSAPGDETKSIRKEKEFPKGLLEGGTLHDNLYITANLGMGVERYVSPNWSLFFQPNYHHYLMSEGIGTNKDKFYTLSFYLGMKVSLK